MTAGRGNGAARAPARCPATRQCAPARHRIAPGAATAWFLWLLWLLIGWAAPGQGQDRGLRDAGVLVGVDWLEARLGRDGLVVLDVHERPVQYFTQGHVAGAVQVRRASDLADPTSPELTGFPDRARFRETLRKWGIEDNSEIVIYDDTDTARASRLWLLLRLHGFASQQVKLLDGGLRAWQQGHALARHDVQPARGQVSLNGAAPPMLVDWRFVYERIVTHRDDRFVLVDTRAPREYTGELAVGAARGGHIPGALNIPARDGVNADGTWKARPDKAFVYAFLPFDKTIVLYGGTGDGASLAAAQLASLGYRRLRILDGGWGFWGNRLLLPVVQGARPYDAASQR